MADNFYGATDAGKMRDNNEDNFIAQKIVGGKYIVGCVIDGVGGYEGGEVAAAIARSAILNTLRNASGDIVHLLKNAFGEASKKIFVRKRKSGENMQMACVATLALADIKENKFYYAHVGDTRLYLFRDKSLVKVTHDHSFVGFLEESGRLTEEAAMNHPKRNEINKALGFNDEKFSETDYVETGESPFLPGDTLLLCSDGLSDMVNSRTITRILNSPKNLKDKSNALIDAANLAGGKDNITVVLIQNNKSPLQHEAMKPIVKKNELIQEVIEAKKIDTEKEVVAKRRGRAGLRFLLVLCFLLLVVLAGFIYNDYFKPVNKIQRITQAPPDNRNEQVKRLLDSLNNTDVKEVRLKNIFGSIQSVVINDSLLIQKDTLHVIGNGTTLIADSDYNGTAFILSSNCKYILLDSFTLENFHTGIFVPNKALHLRKVRFKNCKTSVLYGMQLPDDKSISGSISDSSLIKIDSIKTITNIR